MANYSEQSEARPARLLARVLPLHDHRRLHGLLLRRPVARPGDGRRLLQAEDPREVPLGARRLDVHLGRLGLDILLLSRDRAGGEAGRLRRAALGTLRPRLPACASARATLPRRAADASSYPSYDGRG